jgi:hypothetical protein
MSRRSQSSHEKKARRERNRLYREQLFASPGEPRRRWQGSMSLRFGRHPDAVWNVQWSGVKVAVDLADPNHLDGSVELTQLALNNAEADVS